MPTQSQSGKAFEYALIDEANNVLANQVAVRMVQDATYNVAFDAFNLFNSTSQTRYRQAAVAAINHIVLLEPRLNHSLSSTDILELQLMPDNKGQAGDVRDVLFVRSSQNWEIGISAKNNHKAVKHNRLSDTIDFGNDWLGIPCSPNYFNTVVPIFTQLRALQATGATWATVRNKANSFYLPILNAFRSELMNIHNDNPNIAAKLIGYLIGHKDFYKVIKRRNIVEIYGFNLNKTLGKPSGSIRSAGVSHLRLPTQIIQFVQKPNSDNTFELTCNGGWQLSFRIHNAQTRVVPSLKFDINLIGSPNSMYSHHIAY